jgi:hypothetical protein
MFCRSASKFTDAVHIPTDVKSGLGEVYLDCPAWTLQHVKMVAVVIWTEA